MSCKYWCFTENNEPRTLWGRLGDLQESVPQITYICAQLEEAGRLHLQGYVQLQTSKPLSWVRNQISDTAHWEKQRGNCTQARKYCTPEKVEPVQTWLPHTFTEYGDFKKGRAGRGQRNDIVLLVEAVQQDRSQRSIIEDPTLVQTFAAHLKFHDRVRSLYRPKQNEEGVKVILHVGPPGTGKTRKAFQDYPDIFEIPISNGTMWLDGYDGHKEVLFDDFMGAASKMTLDNTLKYLDRYVRMVPQKGTHAWYHPETIVVTSNYHPRNWYKWAKREKSYRALMRRFHEVVVFFTDSDPEEQVVEDYFYDQELWPEPESFDYGTGGERHF